jgi:hypothetical protein
MRANEVFVTRFGKELDGAIDLPTLTAESYREALKGLLSNWTVQDKLRGSALELVDRIF